MCDLNLFLKKSKIRRHRQGWDIYKTYFLIFFINFFFFQSVWFFVFFFWSGFEFFLCHFMHFMFYFEGSLFMYPAQLCTSCFFPTILIALLWHLVLFTFPPVQLAPHPLHVWKSLSFLSDGFSVCFWILSGSFTVSSLNIASVNFLKTSVMLCESETVCN